MGVILPAFISIFEINELILTLETVPAGGWPTAPGATGPRTTRDAARERRRRRTEEYPLAASMVAQRLLDLGPGDAIGLLADDLQESLGKGISGVASEDVHS